MMHVGDIMSSVGGYHPLYIEYRVRYREYRGGVQYCGGTQITKDFPPTVLKITPTVLNTPMVLKISPRVLSYF